MRKRNVNKNPFGSSDSYNESVLIAVEKALPRFRTEISSAHEKNNCPDDSRRRDSEWHILSSPRKLGDLKTDLILV